MSGAEWTVLGDQVLPGGGLCRFLQASSANCHRSFSEEEAEFRDFGKYLLANLPAR